MNNFVYHNPTKLVFGKGQIARLAKLIPAGKKIMITFGGGSVRRNGIYDQVVKALDRKSTRLNSSHCLLSRMPSSA